MVKNPLKQAKQKSQTLLAFVNFLYWASIIIIFGLGMMIIVGLFLSSTIFHIEKSTEFWYLSIAMVGGGDFFIGVPFKLLPQFIDESTIQAKSGFITMFTFFLLPFFMVFFYGVRQIKFILESMSHTLTPFTEKNALRLKKLAWTVIIYSLVGKLLINLMMILFVTNTISVNIDVDLTGVFVGASLLIIANIFQYGAFLQEEYDTTL